MINVIVPRLGNPCCSSMRLDPVCERPAEPRINCLVIYPQYGDDSTRWRRSLCHSAQSTNCCRSFAEGQADEGCTRPLTTSSPRNTVMIHANQGQVVLVDEPTSCNVLYIAPVPPDVRELWPFIVSSTPSLISPSELRHNGIRAECQNQP